MLTCTNAVSIVEVLPCLGTSEEAVKHVTHHGTHLHLTLTTSSTVCDSVHYIVHTLASFPGHYTLLYTGLVPRPLYCTYTTLHWPRSQAPPSFLSLALQKSDFSFTRGESLGMRLTLHYHVHSSARAHMQDGRTACSNLLESG